MPTFHFNSIYFQARPVEITASFSEDNLITVILQNAFLWEEMPMNSGEARSVLQGFNVGRELSVRFQPHSWVLIFLEFIRKEALLKSRGLIS